MGAVWKNWGLGGGRGWFNPPVYVMAAAAVVTGALLWWTNASWREHFVSYPPMRSSLRQCRADLAKGYLAVERRLAGEDSIRPADVDGYLEQAVDATDDLAASVEHAFEGAYIPFADLSGFRDQLADYRQRIIGFQGLLRRSLLDDGQTHDALAVERHVAFAALQNLGDNLDEGVQQRVLHMAARQDRLSKLLFFVWLSFLALLALTLSLAGRKRRLAEAAHLESEARYRSLFEAVMDVVLVVDEDTGRILDCNPAVNTEWGYDREELVGRLPFMYRQPVPQNGLPGPLVVRYTGGRNAETRETRLITRLEDIRDVSIRTGFFTLGDRRVRLEIHRDVTERNKDETALTEREAMLRSLGDNLPDGVIYKMEVQSDGTRRFHYVSQGVKRLFGVSARKVIEDAKGVFARIVPEDLDILRRAEADALAGLVNIDVQARFVAEDRAVRWGQFRAAPRRTPQGGVVFDGILVDVTEQKQAEDRLRQAMAQAEAANRAKSEFLANISHEVRTPLNGVLGMLQLLETSNLSEEDAKLVATALSCGRGLVRVLADILDFSLLEAGRLELRLAVCSIRALLAEVLGVFSLEAGRKGLLLTVDVDGRTPGYFLTDAARLRQILFNVVGNAIKFTEVGTVALRVELASQRDEEAYLLFTVSDTGIGIAEDRIDDIFKPFTQIDGSLTRKYGGTGLGLGIVRRLVDLLGGVINVDSQPAQGTELAFTVRCRPLAARDAMAGGRAAQAGEAATGKPVRVLVVEDEAVNRLATVSMLRKLGFSAEAAEDGDEALLVLDGGGFDVVLMDIQMPRVSGDEATRRIRRGERPGIDAAIPIIALTAHAMAGDRERCLACGMDDYLSKPVDIEALAQAVSRAARSRRGKSGDAA
jgi:PAS domain S-box-containing protein